MNNTTKILIALSILLAIVAGVAIYFTLAQKQELEEFSQQMDLEKEALEDEFSQLSIQYEGEQFHISNDSLLYQLDTERVKVERLREELRTVKSTNIRRINELKKELTTLRTVMRGYLVQIDSLNTINQKLTEENKSVRKEMKEISTTAKQLERDKEALSEKVTIASRLGAVGITATTIDSRARETKRIKKMEQIRINFTLAQNVTAEIGEKYIYVRIEKPDGDVLVKNRADLFTFEDSEINYSCRKAIEFDGEEQIVTLYWKIEEFFYAGKYRVTIFADNYIIGEKSFELED